MKFGDGMNSLLAAGAWIIDVVFFALIIFGILLGVKRGFIAGICKLAGTIFSIVVGVVFCVSLQASLERNFGTTSAINDAIGAPFGEWIMVILSFLFLVALVKLACWLIGSFGSSLANEVKALRIINMFLGGLLGAFKLFVVFFAVLAILRWIPSESLHEFISSSGVVGKIFDSQWFIDATHMNFHLQ